MRLNTEEWKEFRVGDIFQKKRISKFSSVPETEGDIPFISSTTFNNGVAAKVDEKAIKGNCITVSTNGSCFDCFYHNEPIVVSSDVEVLYSDRLNEKNAMFFCSILNQEKFKYSYGRKPKKDKVFNTVIKLPVVHNEDGSIQIDNKCEYSPDGYIPDFEYMEKYIKSLNSNPLTTFNGGAVKSRYSTLGVEKWKEFTLGDFCYMQRGHSLTSEDKEQFDGCIPCINGTIENNGILCKLNGNVEKIGMKLFKAPFISIVRVGIGGYCLFQNMDCYIADNAFAIKFRDKELENKFVYMFLCTVLNQNIYKYSYGRPVTSEYINTKVRLPIKKDGKPDFEFMENYIKSLPYGDRI